MADQSARRRTVSGPTPRPSQWTLRTYRRRRPADMANQFERRRTVSDPGVPGTALVEVRGRPSASTALDVGLQPGKDLRPAAMA